MMRKILKITALSIITLLLGVAGLIAYLYNRVAGSHPEPTPTALLQAQPQQLGANCYTLGNNWLRKSNSGWWEMHLEGQPFERGVANGKLSKQLLTFQEQAFFEQICRLVPSSFYRQFLKYLIGIYNRDLEQNLTEEQKLEIYGTSLSADHKFDEIGPAYPRMMNYHAAHDIGHALQNLALVGCTSFAAWGEHSADGQLIIGRNFDFYVGDKFGENKIIAFDSPASGHKFMTITWAGMTGVVSGMNMAGLTITLNAAKSELPGGSATPISLLAREILQYASNIDEAVAIAKKRQTFVAESLLIGSAQDNKAVVIEKTPTSVQVYDSQDNYLTCTNHYQSAGLGATELNKNHMRESASVYRQQRLEELISQAGKLNPQNAASILRDQRGLQGQFIGYGNEKAVNQLICHHSVIFQPHKRVVWIASAPWQLGQYRAYDLNKIFAMRGLSADQEIAEPVTIPADTFLQTTAYRNFVKFRQLNTQAQDGQAVPAAEFVRLDPEYYHAYVLAGDTYFKQNEFVQARQMYQTGLTKVIASQPEERYLRKQIEKCTAKLD